LFAKFLRQRAGGPAIDLPVGEVIPHQAATLLAVDPRTTLQEAVESVNYLAGDKLVARFQFATQKAPPGWGSLIRGLDDLFAVPMCLGNFPQMVRDVTPFLSGAALSSLREKPGRPVEAPELAEWGRKMLGKGKLPEALFAVAALRVARQVEQAAELLSAVERAWSDAPANVLVNEKAALAWHRGDVAEAGRLWAMHPDANSPAIRFNRGMAALFADQPREAAAFLMQAVVELPEASAWHHLARLYLVLAGNAAAK
jgi:hypothetical protein